ncbi:MAG: hypothetical protein COX81_03140 [Candidatus Magasanikbacteria bacterium CG_4_10_14_0_2_um_filter_37_12]|uniref:ATP-grasp domain-containing protein n=1 Tax=Candidatus Magasanikbacteria bacterium CG_4_10_14_0_2_um_filter_37_12 TaxID=1974637 RepID=A0A2M7V789_9BACT|nr:MAG: hypothetical protein COX81_03140 [Candidatus Magasanikbacteria bacterium CG_4_10_14_0_2_um_filter_37_12]
MNLKQNQNIVKPNYSGSRTVVVVSNITAGEYLHRRYDGLQFFEERYLYFLEYLKQENTNLVFVVSEGLESAYLDYVFFHASQMTRLSREEMEKRTTFVWVPKTGEKVITKELLKRPDILENIRELAQQSDGAYLELFRTTPATVELSRLLDIPMYSIAEDALFVNEKIGSKKIFAEAGVQYAKGYPAFSFLEVKENLQKLKYETNQKAFLVKVNDGGGGEGIIKIFAEEVGEDIYQLIQKKLDETGDDLSFFEHSIETEGCIVEEFIDAKIVTSPSVQFEVFPDGQIINKATHDQIIFDNVIYGGVSFPAEASYRQDIIQVGEKIIKKIAEYGGIGVMAIDLLATKKTDDDQWKIWAIEINARKGGTNHTNLWTKYLTQSEYDPQRGILTCDKGDVFYRATECFVKKAELKDVTPEEFCKKLQESGLDFDHHKKSGVFVHLLSQLSYFGKFGVTVIGHSREEVAMLWQKLEKWVETLI